jgi:ribA/ribD-fused uncharacterized protein
MSAPVVQFYSTKDAFGEFSNFAAFPIDIDGRTWPTSEHYFQAQKFTGIERQEAIRAAVSPMAAAKMGRDRRQPLRRDWEEVKDGVMLKAVRAKFDQYPKLASMLLETRNAEIVEHTTNDAYWGDGGNGKGKNRLGQILMQVRTELAAKVAIDGDGKSLP